MANTKVTKAVLADDAVGLAQLDISNDPSDGQALTASNDGANNYTLAWANNTLAGISSSADATAITIDSSERVGIGVTSMSNKLVVGGTEAADTTYLRLQNIPATAATHKVAMEFWGNEGTANNGTYNMGRIYGEFDGSSYTDTRLTLGSASGGGTFNDEVNIKNGNVAIGTTNAFGTTSNRTCVSVNGTNSVSLNVGTGGSQRGYMFSDGNSTVVSSVGAIPLKLGVNDQNKTATLNTSGQFSAANIYDGATGGRTSIVSFPNTSSYPNVSTYTFNLTAAQAPIGSRVIMGIRISSGNSSGDQYAYLTQDQLKGNRIMGFIEGWYWNFGGSALYKIDNVNDRAFTFTHGTITATNSNDYREVFYYGYIMDN
jgi:hypothetical protein|tara:strand:+ start:3480 stop:4595 length:1116 start_codon:yes stop_codon:yes gene_type:complete